MLFLSVEEIDPYQNPIFEALGIIAEQNKIILPLHPRTKNKLKEYGISPGNNIQMIDPVGYFEMIWLLSNAKMVITDSGGLQKEAYFFKNPCITLREETEWVELVHNGMNCLAGSDKDLILEHFEKMNKSNIDFNSSFYGIGDAGKHIVNHLINYAN